MYEYRAEVIHVVDGDTLWLDVDLGCDIHTRLSIRLFGVNAPEVSTPDGVQAQTWLRARLPAGARVTLQTVKDKREKYGRYLGTVIHNQQNINDLLLKEGHAVPYKP